MILQLYLVPSLLCQFSKNFHPMHDGTLFLVICEMAFKGPWEYMLDQFLTKLSLGKFLKYKWDWHVILTAHDRLVSTVYWWCWGLACCLMKWTIGHMQVLWGATCPSFSELLQDGEQCRTTVQSHTFHRKFVSYIASHVGHCPSTEIQHCAMEICK